MKGAVEVEGPSVEVADEDGGVEQAGRGSGWQFRFGGKAVAAVVCERERLSVQTVGRQPTWREAEGEVTGRIRIVGQVHKRMKVAYQPAIRFEKGTMGEVERRWWRQAYTIVDGSVIGGRGDGPDCAVPAREGGGRFGLEAGDKTPVPVVVFVMGSHGEIELAGCVFYVNGDGVSGQIGGIDGKGIVKGGRGLGNSGGPACQQEENG